MVFTVISLGNLFTGFLHVGMWLSGCNLQVTTIVRKNTQCANRGLLSNAKSGCIVEVTPIYRWPDG